MSTIDQTAAAPAPNLFFEIAQGYQRTAALKAALELDVFTAIGDGAGTVQEIAARCQASGRGIRMLCDYLTILGFLTKDGDQYALTLDSTAFLSKRSPAYLGGTLEFLNAPGIVRNFDVLAETVRRGTVARDANTVAVENPVWEAFARAMGPTMMPAAQVIAGILGVESAGPLRVLDIAAGHGMFGITLAQKNPEVEVAAVDWPAVLAVATENANTAGVGSRYRMIPGDAFTVDYGSGYDVALVTNFLHHFDRAANVRFLARVAAALTPGGRIAVLEFVPNEDRVTPPAAASFVMNMLAGTPAGDAYTFAELRDMLMRAGFHDSSAHGFGNPETVIVATRS
jgi:2-polyprenyl-3-methyl-5-hydroxy-6-metoxy-1,4-benzoquinol methylase